MEHLIETPNARPHVVEIGLRRPPFNHLNVAVLTELADAIERLSHDDACRAIVIYAEGRAFSAGGDFASPSDGVADDTQAFYAQAMRLYLGSKPIVAAVHGAAVGAGLGLAVAADFRITCAEASFSANFNRLGFHPGFGLSLTLPRLVGEQNAALLFYTGRRLSGEEAVRIGLADALVRREAVRTAALDLAQEIAESAPLAVQSTRATLRRGLADAVAAANRDELAMQREHFQTQDFQEGIAAMAERRLPRFHQR